MTLRRVVEELHTIVIYDIENDRLRTRIADVLLDYGLERIQYSAFLGTLNRNMREELFLLLKTTVNDKQAKIRIIPICEKDARDQILLEQEAENDDSAPSE